MEPAHYSERDSEPRGTRSPRPYLDAIAYGQALSALVITCVDLLFCEGDRRLLGFRRRPPRVGWWLVGGRMFPGESPHSTAIRKAREEAGLEILPNQLQWIGAYSTEFAERSQPPAEEGLHSVNLTFAVRLTAAQAAQVQLSEDEYSEWAWVRSGELPQWVTGNGPMDEALLAIGRAYDRLGSNLMGHGSIELDSDQDRSDERPD